MQRAKQNPIRAAREAKGLSREQAAVKAGLSSTTLRVAEWGGPISAESAAKLAAVLGVKVEQLLAARSA